MHFSEMFTASTAELLENENEILVDILKTYRVLLEKSNTPQQKSKKGEAIAQVCTSMTQLLGRPFDKEKMIKKIANLKMRVKNKSDRNKTGNKPINLLKWERNLLNLLMHDENPTFARLEGAVSAGFESSMENLPEYSCSAKSSVPGKRNSPVRLQKRKI